MTKVRGSSLFFDEDDITSNRSTIAALPRLLRIIFYAFGITNEGYLRRWSHYYQREVPNGSPKDFQMKSGSMRKALIESRTNLTYKAFSAAMTVMGFSIEGVSVRLKNLNTGETRTFSTDDTLEDIEQVTDRDRPVGVQSII